MGENLWPPPPPFPGADTITTELLGPVSHNMIWAASWQNQHYGMCAQRRFGSAWAVRIKKAWVLSYPLRLGGCLGWSESSLGAHTIFVGFVTRQLKCIMSNCRRNWKTYQFCLGQAILTAEARQISKQLHGHLTYFFPGGGALIGWKLSYRNDLKFSNIQVWANIADPDQTWRSSLIRVYIVAIQSASFESITLR